MPRERLFWRCSLDYVDRRADLIPVGGHRFNDGSSVAVLAEQDLVGPEVGQVNDRRDDCRGGWRND